MKLAIFLALSLLVSIATATSSSRESCRKEMSKRSLDKCRSFMRSGRSHDESLLMAFEDDNEGAPPMCCRQLDQVEEECRCHMIMEMMKEMAEEEGFPISEMKECRGKCGEMMMRAKYLPAMCDMSPHTCSMCRFFGGGGSDF